MEANYSGDHTSGFSSKEFQELSTVSYKEQRSVENVSNFGAWCTFFVQLRRVGDCAFNSAMNQKSETVFPYAPVYHC